MYSELFYAITMEAARLIYGYQKRRADKSLYGELNQLDVWHGFICGFDMGFRIANGTFPCDLIVPN